MKSYLVVFFVLLSFVGFGQDSTSNCSQFRFPNVEGGGLGYSYHFYNHFQDFFPAEKMKTLGIKAFRIGNLIYQFDENGFVKSVGNRRFYKRDKERILSRGYLSKSRNDTLWTAYSYTSSSMMIHHNSEGLGHHTLMPSEYIYNENKQVIKFVSTSVDTSNFFYNKVDYTLTEIETTKRDTVLTKVWFNENWQPIRERYYENSLILFEGNYVYENDLLVKYEFYLLRLKPMEIDFEKNIFPDFNDINNYNKSKHQSIFNYNSSGLLEKIIQTTNEGTCEYQVYYYTE